MEPDFYSPSYKTYNMNLPVTTGPASVSSLSGSGSMEPISAGIAYGLQSLSNWLTGRSERKQRQKELEEQRRQFEAQMGFKRQQYQDELSRQRNVARYAAPIFQALASSDIGSGPLGGLEGLFSGQK